VPNKHAYKEFNRATGFRKVSSKGQSSTAVVSVAMLDMGLAAKPHKLSLNPNHETDWS